MSDFLTRVAERALGTAPRIVPQSASRFAPSRLPLPESLLPEMTTAAMSDSALMAPQLDSYDEKPAQRQPSRPPMVAPGTEDAVATDAGHVPALKSDRSPAKSQAADRPPESKSRLIAEGTQTLESQSRSISEGTQQSRSIAEATRRLDSQSGSVGQRDRDAEPPDRASVLEKASIDTLPVSAPLEASMIREDDRYPGSESGPFPSGEPNRRTSEVAVSAPQETARPREEDEPQSVAAVVPKPVTNDRDVESKLSDAVESIRSSTVPRAVPVADERPSAAAMDHQDTRGAISADFVRPATARVGHTNHEREEKNERTIRVTIGRVEVRSAALPPAVVEPIAPPTPKLSLAEFLREHNERHR